MLPNSIDPVTPRQAAAIRRQFGLWLTHHLEQVEGPLARLANALDGIYRLGVSRNLVPGPEVFCKYVEWRPAGLNAETLRRMFTEVSELATRLLEGQADGD